MDYPKIYLYRRVVHAKLYMDDHYAEKIDLDNIADEAFFSKFHFIRLFRKIYGKTPYQYLTSVRLDKAATLLKEGMPVSDVCLAVGFESLSSFSGLFRRNVGQSPSVYQAEQLKLQAEMVKVPLRFIPGCFSGKHGLKV